LKPELVLWALVWVGVNTGPWQFHSVNGVLDAVHAGRAFAPFVAGVAALFTLAKKPARRRGVHASLRLLLGYAIVGLLSSICVSDRPLYALYWGGLYLSAVLVAVHCARASTPAETHGQLLGLNLAAVLLVTSVVVILGWDRISSAQLRWSDPSRFRVYEPVTTTPVVARMAMTRTSGAGRFAGILAVTAFFFFRQGKGLRKLLYAACFVGAGLFVFILQSRTPFLSLTGAILFMLLLGGSGKERILYAGLLLAVLLLAPEVRTWLIKYVERGSTPGELHEMSGRVQVWEKALPLVAKSPIVGWGFHADRIYLHEHMHNAHLHALAQAGLLGYAMFLAAWIWAWVTFWRLLRRTACLDPAHKMWLMPVGGMLAFLTIEAIPSSTAAFYGVDLLILLPILVWLGSAEDRLKAQRMPTHGVQAPSS